MTKRIKTYTLAIAAILTMTLGSPSVWGQSEVVFTFLPGTFVDLEGYDRLNDSITLYYGNTFDSTYIWRTNGTTEGSYIIHRSRYNPPGFGYIKPDYIGVFNGKAYFIIWDPVIGKELWVVDEHATSCTLVGDLVPGKDGIHWASNTYRLLKPKALKYKDNLYFNAYHESLYFYIVRLNETDGLEYLTTVGRLGNHVSALFEYRDALYYLAIKDPEFELRKYDVEIDSHLVIFDNFPAEYYYDAIQKDSIIVMITEDPYDAVIVNLESKEFHKLNLGTFDPYYLDFEVSSDTRMYKTQHGVFFALLVNDKWEAYRTDGTVAGTEKLPLLISNNKQFESMPHGFTDWGEYVYFFYRRSTGKFALARWSPAGGVENVKDFSGNVNQDVKMEILPWKGCLVMSFNGSPNSHTSPWLYCPGSDTWTLLANPPNPYHPRFFATFDDKDLWYVARDDYDQLYVVRDLMVSVEEKSNEATISLHPNPANDLLFLSGLTTDQMEYGSCEILDLLGNTVGRYELAGYPSIDISRLISGNYFIRLRVGDLIITKSFVKM